MDRLTAEAEKRDAIDKEVVELREELKKKNDELKALENGSRDQEQAMESALASARSSQERYDALKGHVLTVARVVLHKFEYALVCLVCLCA